MERMIEVYEALQLMVVNPGWGRWSNSKSFEGKVVKQRILDESWWSTMKYICSIIAPIVDVIRYANTDAPSLGEIYETIDSMLGKMKRIVTAKDPTLGFYEEHIRPIVTRRWNMMNTLLHMEAFALNPKWYAELGGRGLPCDDPEVASSSAAERNWSTYSYIQSIKRNKLTSKRAEKLVTMHHALQLVDCQTPEYRQTSALRRHVEPEDVAQIDEDDTAPGLVGVPLYETTFPMKEYSEEDSDFDAMAVEAE